MCRNRPFIVFLITASLCLTLFTRAGADGIYPKGDVNRDGYVRADDARSVLRYTADIETEGFDVLLADYDGDGVVKASDARMILRVSAGLDPVRPEPPVKPAKILYLTFDDGPSAHTPQILDILDRYNAKATFFVIGNGYYNCYYRDIVDRGHVIGLHSYTHDYSYIYRSVDNYFDDLQRVSDAVYDATGVRSDLIRFPGGSSNQVSRNYCRGIMSTLTREVERRGYHYFDWNSANNDAMGIDYSPDQLYSFAVSYARSGDSPHELCMLMHDTNAKGNTVAALSRIIEYYQSHGYALLGLDENSPGAHHAVAN